MLLLLNRVTHPVIHRLLHANHKMIEDMDKRWTFLRKAWVETVEQSIIFGNGKTWVDAEADEATFTTKDLKDMATNPKALVQWKQWCGIVISKVNPRPWFCTDCSPRPLPKGPLAQEQSGSRSGALLPTST